MTFTLSINLDPGYLMCIVEVTTTPPIFWEMTLYDKYTNNTMNVTHKFPVEFVESKGSNDVGGLYTYTSRVQ